MKMSVMMARFPHRFPTHKISVTLTLRVARARSLTGSRSQASTAPTRVAPAASVKGADGACAAKVRVAIDGPRGGVLPG